MNKRKKKKQVWLRWIGGNYQLYKKQERQHHEELINFRRKAWAGTLTNDDIKSFWLDFTLHSPEQIGKMFLHRRRGIRSSKTAFKRASKALAYSHLKR